MRWCVTLSLLIALTASANTRCHVCGAAGSAEIEHCHSTHADECGDDSPCGGHAHENKVSEGTRVVLDLLNLCVPVKHEFLAAPEIETFAGRKPGDDASPIFPRQFNNPVLLC